MPKLLSLLISSMFGGVNLCAWKHDYENIEGMVRCCRVSLFLTALGTHCDASNYILW